MLSTRIATLALILSLANLCKADLSGSQVTGSAVLPPSNINQFDPANLAAPSWCDNSAGTTVTIANSNPNYDFCALFAPVGTGTPATPAIAIVAAFTGTTLIIQVSLGSQSAPWTPFQLSFADPAFAGLTFVKYTDNFLCGPGGACGVTASLTGTTITINGGVSASGGVYNAAFTLTVPSSTLSLIAPPADAYTFANTVLAWNPVPNAQAYTVWVGEGSIGSGNIYNSWQIPPGQTSTTLPLVWLTQTCCGAVGAGGANNTIWAEVNGAWSAAHADVLTATTNLLGNTPGTAGYLGSVQWENFVYPVNGATNVDPFKPFIWTMNGWHDGSTLTIGSTPGASDVFNSGTIQDTGLPHPVPNGSSLQVSGLQPNTTYYARLTGPSGWNTSTDMKFTTGVGKAHLITPADGAQQVPYGFVPFTINPVAGALQYVLWISDTPGGGNLGRFGLGTATTAEVDLAFNMIYYARVWTQLASGDWTYVDSRLSTYPTDVAFLAFPANGELHDLATAVEGPGVLPNTIEVGWNLISDATGYTLWIGTSPETHDVLDTYQYQVSNNMATRATSFINTNTTYYVTLWTQKGSQWYLTQSVLSTFPQTPVSLYGSDPQ